MKSKKFLYRELRKLSLQTNDISKLGQCSAHAVNLLTQATESYVNLSKIHEPYRDVWQTLSEEKRQERRKIFLVAAEACREKFRAVQIALLDAYDVAGIPTRSLKRLFKMEGEVLTQIKNDVYPICDFAQRICTLVSEQTENQSRAIELLADILKDLTKKQLPKGPATHLLENSNLPPQQVTIIDYIDLDQAAALVGRRERALQRRKDLPPPSIRGKGGKKSEWLWSVMRPWLAANYPRQLPDRPPHAIH